MKSWLNYYCNSMDIRHVWVAACIANMPNNDHWEDHGLDKEANIRYGVEQSTRRQVKDECLRGCIEGYFGGRMMNDVNVIHMLR